MTTLAVATWAAGANTIVLEGCDGAGKTTLAALLARQHGFQVVHSPRTPEGVDLVDRYQHLLARPGRLVMDRSFVSELVYGPMLRERSRIDWVTATALIRAVTNRNGWFVHVTAPTSTIAARLRARGEPMDRALIRRLTHAYEHIFTQIATLAPVITVNTGSGAEARAPAFPGDNQ